MICNERIIPYFGGEVVDELKGPFRGAGGRSPQQDGAEQDAIAAS